MTFIVLVTVITIDLILACIALGGAIIILKKQNRIKYQYFLYKKRARCLREFKELYYSYEIFRAVHKSDENSYLSGLNEENIIPLFRNNFVGKDTTFLKNLSQKKYQEIFRERERSLDELLDEFTLFYNEQEILAIQSFIFWYRICLTDYCSYKIKRAETHMEPFNFNLEFEKKIKMVEEAYLKLQSSSGLKKLYNTIKIK